MILTNNVLGLYAHKKIYLMVNICRFPVIHKNSYPAKIKYKNLCSGFTTSPGIDWLRVIKIHLVRPFGTQSQMKQ